MSARKVVAVAAAYHVLFGALVQQSHLVVVKQSPDRVRDLALGRALTSYRTRFRKLSSRGHSE
jgi:hypothetical protein